MKFTFSWLKEYLDTQASLDEVIEKIDSLGMEVEGVEDPAKALEGFVVGEVLEAEKHPDSDHLQCLIVNDGKQQLKVVCGAPNARKGLFGIFAPAGSYIPGLDVTLKKTNIRGQESNGMMCSEKELCISDEHQGIIELKGNFKAGTPAAEALGIKDVIIDIKILPDMGDLASVYGIARDLAAAGIGQLKKPKIEKIKGEFKSPINVSIKDTKACDIFVGRYIKGVKNGESPKWMQDYLKAAGQKPISALVDITNFMTLAYGRPLHVFDADKLKGEVSVRFANEGEEVEALNDNTYKLSNIIPVICDDRGAISIAGIMGGNATSTDENTKNVFVECAYFSPMVIAVAGQKLKIDSDARYRFERGIDAKFTNDGAELAAKMIMDLCGGTPSEVVVAGVVPDTTKLVKYRTSRPLDLCGINVAIDEQKRIFSALGFTIEKEEKDIWYIRTPSWRQDIDAGEADLVEEITRVHGFDNIPALAVRHEIEDEAAEISPLQERYRKARVALCNRGINEAITWSFMDEKKADLFGAKENPKRDSVRVKNPIASDLGYMRPSILPNLIDAIARNYDRGYPDSALFEVGRIYKSTEYADQNMVIAGVRSGNIQSRHWAAPVRKADAIDAKTDAVAALEACGINVDTLQIVEEAPSYYHPARSGSFKMGKFTVAYFGEVHPGILAKLGRDENYVAFEILLEMLPVPKKKSPNKPLLKMSSLQPLVRDFAFMMSRDVQADKIIKTVKKVDQKLIVDVNVFDIYTGKGIEDGMKSVAFAVTIQPTDKTLTDDEITKLSQSIIAEVEKNTGGKIRA